MANMILKTSAGKFGALSGGLVVAAALWVGLGGSMGAAAPPDSITCLPAVVAIGPCAIDGRMLVVAGNDDTTLAAVKISIGLSFTAAAGPDGNFQLFDGDRNKTNWDVPYSVASNAPCGGSNPACVYPDAPELIVELFADPGGVGGSGPALHTWTPNAAAVPLPALGEHGTFPTANNALAGVVFPHSDAAASGSNYKYALKISPANPTVDRGWNAFKIQAAGTVSLLGNQVVGFIGAMNISPIAATTDGTNPSDLKTIYPHFFEGTTGSNLSDSPYDGVWTFSTTLPAFLGDVTVWDGDMDYGAPDCSYNDVDDPDTPNTTPSFDGDPTATPVPIPPSSVAEGVAQATGPDNVRGCNGNPASGIRTGLPADDNPTAAFRRLPTTVAGLGIKYKIVSPGGPKYPLGQTFINQNPSGNKEWEQFRIQLVAGPADFPQGLCPAGGYPADPTPGKNYPASDCRTDELPGGGWDVVLEGMDLSNLNFWFFSFRVSPPLVDYSIGRRVWFDNDGDGEEDAGEPGAVGVAYTVNVFDSPTGIPDGTTIRAGLTGANGLIDETLLAAGNYTVIVDPSNFASGAVLNGYTSTTGGETESGVEVGLPVCTDTNVPAGCGLPAHADAIFGYVLPTFLGRNAPTNTTCQDYIGNSIVEENSMAYGVRGDTINNVAPGVIFYYTKVTVGAGGGVISVVQSRSGDQTTAGVLLVAGDNQAKLFTPTCGAVSATATQNTTDGKITFSSVAAGTYVVQIKWSPKSLGGKPKPVPPTINYTFQAALNDVLVPGTQNAPALALVPK